MAEKNKQLSLDDGEKAALIFILITWINEEKEEENHMLYDEAGDIYRRLITL